MKKYIFLILFIPILSFSQQISISELINLSNYNDDDFDTLITSKNYTFKEIDKADNNAKKYSYETNDEYYKGSYRIKKVQHDGIVTISWSTYEKEDYLSIKAQIKNNGFVFVNSTLGESLSFFDYKKGKYHLSIMVLPKTFKGRAGYVIILDKLSK